MSTDDISAWIASNPKLLHVLFGGIVLLSQIGIVAANNSTGTGGP